jgi:mRNA interferase RelE/StbE
MHYEVFRYPQALRQLRHLHRFNPQLSRLIIASITALSENPRPPGSKKLVNHAAWRIRVRDYRVLYEIDDKNQTVTIISVSHRRDVYK